MLLGEVFIIDLDEGVLTLPAARGRSGGKVR